jgi:inorganic triphosphatase YgiF
MPAETELKLLISPSDADKLVQHPLLQSARNTRKSQHLYNTYFDTTNHDLLQHGVGLRVRHIGDKRLQTLKTAGSGLGGLHQRQEWETEITADTPDYTKLPASALPKWCANEKKLKKITALFTTDFMRTTWQLKLKDGSKMEVALDQGEIKTQTGSIPLSEVELELKSGTPDKLYKIALTLQDTLPLRVENQSKAAHGYALLNPQSPLYHKAGAVNLNPDMTAEQAFTQIIWYCLEHLQANEDVVLHGSDIEGVHQMRVALRRLRSCLSLYKSLIPKKTHVDLLQKVQWISDILGVARDWDVFALSLQNIPRDNNSPFFSSQNWLDDLSATVADKQAQAYVMVRDSLRSSDYSHKLLLWGRWLTQRRWRRKLDAYARQNLEKPVREVASKIIQSRYQRVKELGENFAKLNFEQFHNLRIAVKKMVYGTRFFAELYPHKIVRPYAKILSRLQDELGIVNDGNVASNLLNQAGLDENAPARHFLNGWYANQHKMQLANLERTWQAFLEQQTFWKI